VHQLHRRRWHVNKSICFIDDILGEIFAKCHKVYDLSLLFGSDWDGTRVAVRVWAFAFAWKYHY